MQYPEYTSLLYCYGKYIIKAKLSNYYGSAIGALEECLRSCIKERHGNIYYYLGLAYKHKEMGMKTFEYWEQANKNLSSKGKGLEKKREIQKFVDDIKFPSTM